MSKLKLLALLGLALTTTTHAHNRWIIPSHYSISAEKNASNIWIMADVTASNSTFYVDKAMGVDRFTVLSPTGEDIRIGASFTGHRKSVVDINLKESGTYKLFLDYDMSYWTNFTSGKEEDWIEADKQSRKSKLPKGAKKPHTIASKAQVISYVTVNAPTNNFHLSNEGLELKPITHPSDIAQNEETKLQFLYDGKPQKNVKIEIIKDGTRYRNNPEALALTSNKNGEIAFTLKDAGRYLLIAHFNKETPKSPLADEVEGEIFFTFEAVLN